MIMIGGSKAIDDGGASWDDTTNTALMNKFKCTRRRREESGGV